MSKLDELLKRQEELAAEIEEVKKVERKEVLEEVKKLIKQFGLTQTELRSAIKVRRRKKKSTSTGETGKK